MECKCTLRQYLVGDGCEVCNPGMAADVHAENCREARVAKLVEAAQALADHLDECWYEADPCGDVKKGDHHPWADKLRAALDEWRKP